MLVDGLSTPVRLGTATNSGCNSGVGSSATTCNLGQIAMNQWQANIYTQHVLRSPTATESRQQRGRAHPGADQHPVPRRQLLEFQQHRFERQRRLQRGVPAVQLVRDRIRLDPLQEHGHPRGLRRRRTLPTAPAPARRHLLRQFRHCRQHWRTRSETVPVPALCAYPGAFYCTNGGLRRRAQHRWPPGGSGRINRQRRSGNRPPFGSTEGWQGFSGQNSFIEFGKAALCDRRERRHPR